MKTTNEWSMKAQWYARWCKHDGWESAVLATPHGYATVLLDRLGWKNKPGKYLLLARFIWQGREYQLRREQAKPFTRKGAVRIVNRWIREKVGVKT
jgi:hypothetical protein